MPDCKNCKTLHELEAHYERKVQRLLEQNHFLVSSTLALIKGLYEAVHSAGYTVLTEEDKKEASDFRLGIKDGMSGTGRK